MEDQPSMNQQNASEKKLYFVISPEDGMWVARGLQHKVVTYGESLEEVRRNIDAVVWGYRETKTLDTVGPAEAQYWAKFIEAHKMGRNLDDFLDEPVENED